MTREKYTYKGDIYFIQDETAFKHPESRKWIEAFIYYSASTGKRWVREKEEFLKLFNKVEDETR